MSVPLRELNAQRLHHGLSEIILVNTLTDVREFKKDCSAKKKRSYLGFNYLTKGGIEHGFTKETEKALPRICYTMPQCLVMVHNCQH